jgi:hypothetical protein
MVKGHGFRVSYRELASAPPESIKPFKLVMQGLVVQGLDEYVPSSYSLDYLKLINL